MKERKKERDREGTWKGERASDYSNSGQNPSKGAGWNSTGLFLSLFHVLRRRSRSDRGEGVAKSREKEREREE